MRNISIKLLLLTCIFSAAACAQTGAGKSAAAPASWNPQRTWVYMAGLLKWKDSKQFASFPQKNRRDKVLLDVLRAGGVPESQIMYLKDAEATSARVAETFPKFLARAKPGDTVIVYFCGHGYKSGDNLQTFLATYDAGNKVAGWQTTEIPAAIEKNFRGANAMIMADNCYSGALAEDVKALKNSRISYAVMTSAHFNSFSTGNWTFTESLIYAFRGDATVDDDGDGKVTFGELEKNAEEDMLFGEEQRAQFVFTGNFDRGAVVTAAQKNSAPRIGERVESYSIDGYYKGFIRDAKDDKFQVRYYGYEETDDEWVTAKMIRPPAPPKQFKAGAKVEVEWLGKWFPARIAEVNAGSHLVKYDGYGVEYDEWVPSKRIREQGAQTAGSKPAHGVGALIEAQDYRGQWYPSRVLEFKDGKYKVHYFGWDKKWDEWVTPAKIRNSSNYDFGREVEAEQNGTWYPARVVDSRSGEYLVTYTGYDEDEWVKENRVREVGRHDARLGRRVEVLSRGKWYEARILDTRGSQYYVHYEGYGDSWNEWVDIDKTRKID